jgi:hypothetical protein
VFMQLRVGIGVRERHVNCRPAVLVGASGEVLWCVVLGQWIVISVSNVLMGSIHSFPDSINKISFIT